MWWNSRCERNSSRPEQLAVLPPSGVFLLLVAVVALSSLLGCLLCIVRNNLSGVVCERCPTQCLGHPSESIKAICAAGQGTSNAVFSYIDENQLERDVVLEAALQSEEEEWID
jgi:hypothetical protein